MSWHQVRSRYTPLRKAPADAKCQKLLKQEGDEILLCILVSAFWLLAAHELPLLNRQNLQEVQAAGQQLGEWPSPKMQAACRVQGPD